MGLGHGNCGREGTARPDLQMCAHSIESLGTSLGTAQRLAHASRRFGVLLRIEIADEQACCCAGIMSKVSTGGPRSRPRDVVTPGDWTDSSLLAPRLEGCCEIIAWVSSICARVESVMSMHHAMMLTFTLTFEESVQENLKRYLNFQSVWKSSQSKRISFML